jgi:hypothetical protein
MVLNTAWGITMLSVIWGVAGGGVLLRVAWPTAPKWLAVSLYVTVGWLALIPTRELLAWFAPFPLALLVLGGVLYTLGGVVYALRKPNPWPRVLGYHEIFHLLVIADKLPEKQESIGGRPVTPGARDCQSGHTAGRGPVQNAVAPIGPWRPPRLAGPRPWPA